MKLTYIHLGLGMSEVGVQFEADDGAGGVVKGRAFLNAEEDDDVLAPLWLRMQTKLAAERATLPVDLPPGAVTNALMQKRTAEQAARAARDQQLEAERKAAEAEARLQAADAEHESRQRQIAMLDAQIAAKRARVP